MSAPRNVVMILADDWSPLARCYGNDVIDTRHIDAFAEKSTVFTHAFCTTPSCAASRASILTGHHSHRHLQFGHCHGVHHFRTKESMPTLPSVLKDAGVYAEIIGKSHTAPAQTYPWAKHSKPAPTPEGFRQATAAALDRDAPCYIMVAPTYPHRGGKRGFLLDDHAEAFDDRRYDPSEVIVPDFLPDLPETREDLANYYEAVTRYDQCVGGALRAIEASGKADETLVMVFSDHAMPFPGAKASVYDTGHRCGLIVHQPGQPASVRCEALVNWLDLAPTAYDFLGVAPPADPPLPGRSLLPILDQARPAGWDQTTFSHSFHEVTMYDPYRVLRERKYKFVQRLNHQAPMPFPSDLFDSLTARAARAKGVTQWGQRPWSLYTDRPYEAIYDMEADPMETTNLIDRPELAKTVQRMRKQLIAERFETDDPWLMVDYQWGNPEVSKPDRVPG